MSAPSISISEAAQVLRPPQDGMPFCRLNEAEGFDAGPASVSTSGDRISILEASPDSRIGIDATGCSVIPGFVDCHTHLPFAGWRASEYEMKVTGVPYEEIARQGGGIKSSAEAFASATDEEVLDQAGLLAQRMGQVQELGRLLSTRQQTVSLAGRSRLVLPEGFRDFLAVEAGSSLMVVGAAVCVELWQPAAWNAYVTSEMPGFRQRIDDLTA